MKPRRQRLALVIAIVAGVGIAAGFALRAFQENLLYFYSPTQVAEGQPPQGRKFRVGGLVTHGSVRRESGSLEVQFDLTDNEHTVTVMYAGILPDLFREGQGIIAHGRIDPDGKFVADEVLAKHDENYMPPEVADALDQAHGRKGEGT
jgi:cytochrome c-type biogenesis protein CcmE